MPDLLGESGVFESSTDALFVSELLVHSVFLRVRAGRDADVHLEARRENAEELDAAAEADEGSHATVLNSGCDVHEDGAVGVVDSDGVFGEDGELLGERLSRALGTSRRRRA